MKTIATFLSLFIASLIIVLTGCVKPEPEQTVVEEPPAPQATVPDTEAQPQVRAKLPPPKPAEVQEAIKRVYEGAVTVDGNHKTYFIVGDYNGDFSEDIAIIVRPVESSLADINHELADWMLCDPTKTTQPDSKVVVQREPPKHLPVVIEKGDLLLAVIHGYGETGWRNLEATQTYLLKNAVNGDMRTYSTAEFREANKGSRIRFQLRGDLIGQVFEGNTGFIYYNGARYSWHGPRNLNGPHNLKGEVDSRSIH